MRPATRRLVTNEMAATGGVMYADEGSYTIDDRHFCLASIAKFLRWRILRKTLKRWWGRLEKRRMATESAKKCFKGNYITTMYFVLCIVCCVVYCLLCITVLCCANKQMQKMFQRKLYNNYVFCVVYCLLCYVLFVVYHSTVLCQQSNANFFNKI